MEESVLIERGLTKIVGWFKIEAIGGITYSCYCPTFESVGKPKKTDPVERTLEILSDPKFINNRRGFLDFLTGKEQLLLEKLLKKSGEIKEYTRVIEQAWAQEFEYVDIYGNKQEEENTRNKSLMDLFHVDPKVQTIAKVILNDDNEYPYKTDKVRGLVRGEVSDEDIVKILSLREEYQVTLGYVNSIKQKMLQ